jgi:flavin reductase (DIM6/NTAB) family NADH-FMN oxidoreductase RutF
MNIVTFASAVSVADPKYWMISLFYNTLTKDSFCKSKEGVLQLLTPEQKDLVPLLGKRSGYEKGYSKAKACREVGMSWVNGQDFVGTKNSKRTPVALLPQCAMYLHVRLHSSVDAGDHVVTICQLVSTGQWDEASQSVLPIRQEKSNHDNIVSPVALDQRNVLYTGLLRKEGIL